MIVELYGLPASGKTTLARKMVSDGYVRVKIKNKKELLFYNFLFLAKHPVKFVASFIYVILNFGSASLFYYKFINAFLDKNAKYQKSLRFKKSLIDQGHIQNIVSVFENKLTPREMIRYLRFLPLPDKLIVFDVNRAKRDERAGQRGYSARMNFGSDYQKEWREIIEYNDKLLKSILKDVQVEYFTIK